MSGYQTRLMADLNLHPPNSKTLVLIVRLTLRDASQKKTKPLSGILGGRSCVAPGPGLVLTGVVAVDSLTPLPLTSACTCRVRNHSPHPKTPPFARYFTLQSEPCLCRDTNDCILIYSLFLSWFIVCYLSLQFGLFFFPLHHSPRLAYAICELYMSF